MKAFYLILSVIISFVNLFNKNGLTFHFPYNIIQLHLQLQLDKQTRSKTNHLLQTTKPQIYYYVLLLPTEQMEWLVFTLKQAVRVMF